MDQPRQQHYHFAYTALPARLFAGRVSSLLLSTYPNDFEPAMLHVWNSLGEQMPPKDRVPLDRPVVTAHRIGGSVPVLLIHMPPPQRGLETYFVAVVFTPRVRYFTLGRSPRFFDEIDHEPRTTFRELTADGTNANRGSGPAPTVEGFLRRLCRTLDLSESVEEISDGELREFAHLVPACEVNEPNEPTAESRTQSFLASARSNRAEAALSDKARRDRRMQAMISIGSLIVILGCGGLIWRITSGNDRKQVTAPAVGSSLNTETENQTKRELEEREAKRRAEVEAIVKPWLPSVAGSPIVADPRTLYRRNKLVIWDATTQAPGSAYAQLPDLLQGKSSDGELTIAVVLSRHNVEVASYELSPGFDFGKKIPGYRVEMEIGLFDLPQKKALGRMTVSGDDPPPTIKRMAYALAVTDDKPEYGDTDSPLARWLEARPRVGQPDRIGDARAKSLDGAANGNFSPPLSGKVLIWDMKADVPSEANRFLPEANRGKLNDPDLNIVLIAQRNRQLRMVDEDLVNEMMEKEKEEKKHGVRGTVTAIAAGSRVFREQLEIRVISHLGAPLGKGTVDGALLVEPDIKERWLRPHIVGDSSKELARWLQGIPVRPAKKQD